MVYRKTAQNMQRMATNDTSNTTQGRSTPTPGADDVLAACRRNIVEVLAAARVMIAAVTDLATDEVWTAEEENTAVQRMGNSNSKPAPMYGSMMSMQAFAYCLRKMSGWQFLQKSLDALVPVLATLSKHLASPVAAGLALLGGSNLAGRKGSSKDATTADRQNSLPDQSCTSRARGLLSHLGISKAHKTAANHKNHVRNTIA
jgi:hypothetical protein